MKSNTASLKFNESPVRDISIRLALIFLLIAGLFSSGCQTSGKMLASTAITVDEGMKSWAIWVKHHGTTPEQEVKVKSAYMKYQVSMELAGNVYADMTKNPESASVKLLWKNASEVLKSNQKELLGLIEIFTKGGAK